MSANDPQPASARPANAGCGAAPCSADDLLAMCLSRFETIQETHPEIALDAEVSLLTEYLNRAPNPPPYHYSGEQWQHPDWEGKRILIAWTYKAYSDGAEWPSFVVERETEDGLFLRGCDAPDGTKHDGTHCFAKHEEIRDLWEWVSEANAEVSDR